MTPTGLPRASRKLLLLPLLLLLALPLRPAQPKLAYKVDLAAPVRTDEAVDFQARWLAVATEDEVRVLDPANGHPVTVLPCAGARISRFAKNRLLLAGREGADLYETPSFKKLWTYRFPVEMAAISGDASLIVLAQNRPQEKNLSVVMLDGQGQGIWSFNGKGMSLRSLDASSDGRYMLIHWNEPKDQFWLYNPWQKKFIVDGAGLGALHAGSLAQLAKGRLRVVDLDRGLLTGPVDCSDATLSFSPDGDHVLTGGRCWRTTDLTAEGSFPGAGQSRFLGSSDRVVTWQPNGNTTVWEASSGTPVTTAFTTTKPQAVAGFGSRLAVAGGKLLQVWEW